MPRSQNTATLPKQFSPPEREIIRRAFGMHFGAYPSVANGILLRTWRGGDKAGQPKITPPVQSLMDRGFVELHPKGPMYVALLTEAGLEALKLETKDRRFLNPVEYRHVFEELGLAVPDKAPLLIEMKLAPDADDEEPEVA